MKKKGKRKQGRIHDCSCRGRLGRGSNNLGRGSINLGRGVLKYKLFYPLKCPKMQKKQSVTDGPTDRRTDTVTYRSRARDKNQNLLIHNIH